MGPIYCVVIRFLIFFIIIFIFLFLHFPLRICYKWYPFFRLKYIFYSFQFKGFHFLYIFREKKELRHKDKDIQNEGIRIILIFKINDIHLVSMFTYSSKTM